MTDQTQHLFIVPPMFDSLAGAVARSLAQGQARLAAAGLGMAALGPVERAGVIVDQAIFGRAGAGLKGFFPLVSGRAQAFAGLLTGPVGRLVLPVMPLDQGYPVLWRQQAARRVMPEFAELAPRFAALERGWADLARELIAAFTPRELILLPAPVSSAQVLGALVPEAGLAPIEPVPAVMPDTAIAMLQRLYRQGAAISPRQAGRLAQTHGRAPQPAPLAAFDPLTAASLRHRFALDLERLAALPGVRIGLDGLDLACAAE